jgi:hypothetical protein
MTPLVKYGPVAANVTKAGLIWANCMFIENPAVPGTRAGWGRGRPDGSMIALVKPKFPRSVEAQVALIRGNWLKFAVIC